MGVCCARRPTHERSARRAGARAAPPVTRAPDALFQPPSHPLCPGDSARYARRSDHMATKPPAPHPKVDAYIAAAAEAFPIAKKEVKDALDLIRARIKPTQNAQALQLLALRRYLRLGGSTVQAHWAWTAEEARRFANQGAFKLLVDEAAKVKAKFAAANPGYTLGTSPLRSLERQVRLWNGNSTVQRAADNLQVDMLAMLQKVSVFPDGPTGRSVVYFTNLLRAAPVKPEPTSAVPGTSDHGQMRAVDFVVVRPGGQIVADTKSATIQAVWKLGGWEAKLVAAAACTKLIGPLQHPYERGTGGWHGRERHRPRCYDEGGAGSPGVARRLDTRRSMRPTLGGRAANARLPGGRCRSGH